MQRALFFGFGAFCHALFLCTFLYMIGFVGDLLVPKSIDSPAAALPVVPAVVLDLGLLALFAVPHSVMARPAFKAWWTRFVPRPVERSVYVLFACLCVIALMAFWQPIGGTLWHLENPIARGAAWALFACGWLGVPLVSLLINHFDLFGTRQVWLHLRNEPYTVLPFRTPLVYKLVRHPLYVGWMVAFWAAPTMTVGHALFAAVLTTYMIVAIRYEERDLVDVYGERYEQYRREVPALVPKIALRGRRAAPGTEAEAGTVAS